VKRVSADGICHIPIRQVRTWEVTNVLWQSFRAFALPGSLWTIVTPTKHNTNTLCFHNLSSKTFGTTLDTPKRTVQNFAHRLRV
jgi:hypothetical protein